LVTLPAPGRSPLVLATPFRPLDPGALPERTRRFPLDDPDLLAVATVLDLLTAVRRDLRSASQASTGDAARRERALLDFYRVQAVLATRQLVSTDIHADERPPPSLEGLAAAVPQLLARIAASPRGFRALGLHLVSRYLDAAAESLVLIPGRRLATLLDEEARLLADQLAQHRDAARKRLGLPDDGQLMVVLRPAGEDAPILVWIPPHEDRVHTLVA
jgi:hypothetical protein